MMNELLIKRQPSCDCEDKPWCEHGWDMRFCCRAMEDEFSDCDGGGGSFYVETDNEENAVGVEWDLDGSGAPRHIDFCPWCGARPQVVDALPAKETA